MCPIVVLGICYRSGQVGMVLFLRIKINTALWCQFFFIFLYYYFECIDNPKKMKMCWKIICRAVSLKKNYQVWNVERFSIDEELMQLPGFYIAAVSQELPSPLWLCGLGCTYNKGTVSQRWWKIGITLEGQSSLRKQVGKIQITTSL